MLYTDGLGFSRDRFIRSCRDIDRLDIRLARGLSFLGLSGGTTPGGLEVKIINRHIGLSSRDFRLGSFKSPGLRGVEPDLSRFKITPV